MKTWIQNVGILTIDGQNNYYPKGDIVYDGDTISYVGSPLERDQKTEVIGPDNAHIIDGKGMLALPGFVNTHTHIAMTAFRGYADNLPLWEWLTTRIWPMEDRLEPGDTYWLSLLGAAEMISAGVTSFLDMYMHMTDIAKAVSDCGIRAVLSRGITGSEKGMEEKYEEAEELYLWENQAEGRIRTMIAPHAVYTCSPEIIHALQRLAMKQGVGIHIHLSETQKEVADCIRDYGRTPAAHLHHLGLLELPVVAAHCVHLTGEDMDLMAKYSVKAVHCPSSNMKLASGFAPVDEMRKRGITVSLGTDGAASNNNLSIWKEMSLASLIAKGNTGNAEALPAKAVLEMATIQGARTLQLQDETGSLEPGKKADIQLIDISGPHYYPKEDPVVHLVYSGYSGDVNTVIINGKVVMKDKILTTIDLNRVYGEVDRIIERIR